MEVVSLPANSRRYVDYTMLNRFRFLYVIAVTISILAASLLSYSQVQRDSNATPHFDVYDEAAHFDYVLKLKENAIPAWGSQYDQLTLRIVDCLGTFFTGPGDCSEKKRPVENYAPRGFNYEAQQPPIGYLPYVFHKISSTDNPKDILMSLRLFGSKFWLILTALLLTFLFVMNPVKIMWVVFGAFAIFVNPTFVHAVATVNNDAAVVPVVLIWIITEQHLRFRKNARNIPGWILRVVVSIILGAVKGFLVLIPISYFLASGALKYIRERRTPFDKSAFLSVFSFKSVAPSIAAVLTYLVFLGYQKVAEKVPSSEILESLLGFSKTDHLRATTILDSLSNLLSSQRGYYLGLPMDTSLGYLFSVLFFSLLLVKAFMELNSLGENRSGSFALTSLLLIISLSIAWPLVCFLQGGYDFSTPSRYALMVIPIIAYSFATFSSNNVRLKDPSRDL